MKFIFIYNYKKAGAHETNERLELEGTEEEINQMMIRFDFVQEHLSIIKFEEKKK